MLLSCNSSPSSKGTGSITSISSITSDISVMEYYKANIDSDTASVGKQQNTTRSLKPENILVKSNGGAVEQVYFEAVKNRDENGNAIFSFNGEKIEIGQILSQQDISAKLDKVYVTDKYTFVSYLTIDADKLLENSIKEHPSSSKNSGNCIIPHNEYDEVLTWQWYDTDDCMRIDFCYSYHNGESSEHSTEYVYFKTSKYYREMYNEAKGITYNDTTGYHTNKFRSSFIIDNNTGLIYSTKTPNLSLDLTLENGVPFDKELGPIEIETLSDGTLNCRQLIASKDIIVCSAFKDKYGQYYVLTSDYDVQEANILCFSEKTEYIPTKNGDVLHIRNTGEINVVTSGFKEKSISESDNYKIEYCTPSKYYQIKKGDTIITSLGDKTQYYFYNISNGVLHYYSNDYNYKIVDSPNSNTSPINDAVGIPIDEFSFVKIDDTGLYIGKIDYETNKVSFTDSLGKAKIKEESNSPRLDDSKKYLTIPNTALDLTYYILTISGTFNYRLRMNKNTGEYELIEISRYEAQPETIILQPINR